MLDLGFEVLYDTQSGAEVEEFKKDCFSLNTPKQCNDQEMNSDIFNDGIFDLQDFNQDNLQNNIDMFHDIDDRNDRCFDYRNFQHSMSEESSIISYPDQISPTYLNVDPQFKKEPFHNSNPFPNIDEHFENDSLGMTSFSNYANYRNMHSIILQPVISSYNSIVSPTAENMFPYPVMNATSNFLNLPSDTIVYVPTPVRDLQSNYFFNTTLNNELTQQIHQPYLKFSSYQNLTRQCESSKFIDSFATIKSEIIETNMSRDSTTTKKVVQTDKTFCCSTCNVKFTRRDELRRHEKIHSGEKPLSCPYCDKCFIRSDHRKTHIRTHTGEKPYACDICQKRFARSDEKLRHTKTHYRERPRRRRRKKAPEIPFGLVSTDHNSFEPEPSTVLNWEVPQHCNYFSGNDPQSYVTSINSIFNTDSQYSSSLLEQLWSN